MKQLTILFLLISQIALAQNNFLDGYVILKNESDTIKGKIDYLNWSENPVNFVFQQNGSPKKEIQISTLKAFGIYNKENYWIKKVDLDESPFTYTELLKSSKRLIKKDTTIALLVLLQAQYNLLHFKDNTRKEHFYLDDAGVTRELIFHKYLTEQNSKTYEVENKKYITQLDSLFSICNKTISTKDLTYEMNLLTEKFIEFNDCMGCKYTCYIKKREDIGMTSFGILGGMGFESLSQSYLNAFRSIRANNQILSPSFNLGFSYSIHSRRDFGRRILRLELYYENQIIKNSLSNYNINLSFLNLNILYRKELSFNKAITPFYGGGINARIHLKSAIDQPIYFDIFDVKSINPFLTGEFGIAIKNIEFFSRIKYDPLRNNVIYTEYRDVAEVIDIFSFSKWSFQIIASYQFNNKRKIL
jgi:hypothetical protein